MQGNDPFHAYDFATEKGAQFLNDSAPLIDAPQALHLKREPVANVERYDSLRDQEMRHAS